MGAMGVFPKTARLKDGSDVVIRPMESGDLERSHEFFLTLPPEDRLMMRMDVTDLANVRIRMEASPANDHWRLIGLRDDTIVGDATLSQPRYGWKRHTAEVRCIIAEEHRGRGLGFRLLNELFQEATRRKVERLCMRVMKEQVAAIRIGEGLGFRHELTQPDHRRTLDGEFHDVMVMTVSLADLWRRLEDAMLAMDGQGRERH
jgi:RimJ/RimL family protein N-acetyltransferase